MTTIWYLVIVMWNNNQYYVYLIFLEPLIFFKYICIKMFVYLYLILHEILFVTNSVGISKIFDM